MKATLEFILPEENSEHLACVHAACRSIGIYTHLYLILAINGYKLI
jgi:hypothetical protein